MTRRAIHIASVSGGKDSAAMMLHLRERDIPFRAVFYDTGWEHDDVYAYLDYLRETLDVEIATAAADPPDLTEEQEQDAAEVEALLGRQSMMVRWIVKKGMFPSRTRRFCTQILKIFVAQKIMRSVHDEGLLPVNVVGIRAAESAARAQLPERELSTTLDCMVWRPLIAWSEQDVIDIHKRHNVNPNPLYLRGARRVGCWPCIQAGKAELRMLAQDEHRIRVIERLEAIVQRAASARAEARGEELRNPPAFFQHPTAQDDGVHRTTEIRDMLHWAQTLHGGKILDRSMMFPGMNEGCLRWGMCDLGGGGEE